MSFSSEIKEEILNQVVESDCCQFAFLTGVINSIGSLELSRNGVTFSLRCENYKIIEKLVDIINGLYSDKVENLEIVQKSTGKVQTYEVVFPLGVGNRILKDCMILTLSELNTWEINKGIDHHIILEDCCKTSYLKAVFLCAGTVSVPVVEKENGESSGDYHFELEFTSLEQAKAVSHLLGEFGFITKKVERASKQVVYMKESESIADFVGFVGATRSYLKLQNEMITRDMRNSINRQANCMSANISKTVGASLIQLKAIEVIENTIGLESLSEDLTKVAKLRKEYPDSSLADLIEISNGAYTKSGLNYKFKKLIEIANNL